MTKTQSTKSRVTRRALVAGAAAGTLAATTDMAAAQRCPETPAARTKGPLVWMDMDQHELDESYDQSVYAFNQRHITDRRTERNEIVLKLLGKPDRVAYGPTDIEKVDIYKTRKPNAPVMIYIHGGSWQRGSSTEQAFLAEPFVKAGAHFIVVEFNNVRELKGDLTPMVDQCRRAVAFVYRNSANLGSNSNALYLSGSSSGAHLGGCVVITEWEKQGLPRDILKGAVLSSGMYDLKAPRLSKRSAYVAFTDTVESAFSAQRQLDKVHTPLVLVHGTLETPDFQRQTKDFYAAVRAAGKPVQLVVGKGYNHFEVGESLGNPYGLMGRAAFEMMKLTTVV
jgi:arylformamidase